MMRPEWLEWAMREAGVREIVGDAHNPRVVEYWRIGRVPLQVTDDETPWCAAFVCAALEASGVRSARTPRARGFADSTHMVECPLRIGAIVVLSSDRGAASGHVGIASAVGPGRVHLWGGNQGNRVCEAPFPASRIVAVRWPLAAPVGWERYPEPAVLESVATKPVSDR